MPPFSLIGEPSILQEYNINGFRAIAGKHHGLLIENAIEDIVKDRRLTNDRLHPTPVGNKLMAKKIYEALTILAEN